MVNLKDDTYWSRLKSALIKKNNDCSSKFRSKHSTVLKALVVKNSVLHDFGFGKVSPAKQL